MLIHLAETRRRGEDQRETEHQATPTGYLESIGFWAPRTLAAHGVWVTDEDIAILKRRDVGVSHNPESNMKLASGTAPVVQVSRAPASRSGSAPTAPRATTTSTCSRRCARRRSSPSWRRAIRRAVPAQAALDMATIGGARALGMEQTIGSLEPGKRADLITVSMGAARQTPMYDAVSHLVYVTRGDDVRTTIVNGKVLMRDRQVLTLERAMTVIADANALGRASVAAPPSGEASGSIGHASTRSRRCTGGSGTARRNRARSRRRNDLRS